MSFEAALFKKAHKLITSRGALEPLGSGISSEMEEAGMLENTICELSNFGFDL